MMQVHIKTALSSLLAQKLRAFLAMLGVLVGTASVVALVSSGQLASLHAIEQFRSLGTNLLSVTIYYEHSSTKSTAQDNGLQLSEIKKMNVVIPGISTVAPYVSLFSPSPLSYKGEKVGNTIVATTASMQDIVKLDIAQGRFISSLDRYSNYCVIGDDIAKKLKKLGLFNPLGAELRVGNHYLKIIGIAKPWPENLFLFVNLNKAIMVPIEATSKLSTSTQIHHILFRVTPRTAEATQPLIKQYLTFHQPKAKLFFRSPKQIIARMNKQHNMFTWLLGLIGSISLLVGGVGIMNIMLVSVVERKHEIGIRLAIGARDKDIQYMFLCETTLLTFIGGFIGVLIGLGITAIIATMTGWPFYILPLPILLGFTISVAVGLFFGFYPARRASRLEPIDALRSQG